MKRVAVAMILTGSMLGQARKISETAIAARSATITIGIDLQLGMSRDAVVAQLAARYKVVKIHGSDDDWVVKEKETPMLTIGQLEFKAGKLTYASRIWTQGQGDDDFAQALREAKSEMDRGDRHACSFEAPVSHSSTAEISYTRLNCGPKKIDITTINVLAGSAKRDYTSVSEVLSSDEVQ